MSEWANRVHTGDAIERLSELPESSVHMCMTSPPYFGLRDYGVEGQIGLEDSLDAYIQNLVDVGEELRRVLRDDGSWWLNLGDSYGGNSIVRSDGEWTRPGDDGYEEHHVADNREDAGNTRRSVSKLGRKNKLLVPHRTAIALQEVGWVLRNDVTWYKPNPIPSPVKDRLNTTTEKIFHLTPEPDYWYDLDAIREDHTSEDPRVEGGSRWESTTEKEKDGQQRSFASAHPSGKNPGDVFEVTTKPFPDAHFAVYPPELCEKPIKSSCPSTVCASCGTPYERVTEQVPMWDRDPSTIEREQTKRALELADEHDLTEAHFKAARSVGLGNLDGGEGNPYERVDDDTAALAREAADTLGSYYREALMSEVESTDDWRQVCSCDTSETEPGVVLDPFTGAGTTCLVAKEHGRRFVGIELNPEYADMARARIGIDVHDPSHVTEDDAQTSALDYL